MIRLCLRAKNAKNISRQNNYSTPIKNDFGNDFIFYFIHEFNKRTV